MNFHAQIVVHVVVGVIVTRRIYNDGATNLADTSNLNLIPVVAHYAIATEVVVVGQMASKWRTFD